MIDGLIQNWQPIFGGIVGTIYNDRKKRFEDGYTILTSTVEGGNSNLKEGDTIITRNSSYMLGSPQRKEIANNGKTT